ncbi:uncharacterized protein LOC111705626 [Eurytemora carolleeae]|uniref:uncharacterized protein LOC111705626 n=1 Tax=Eurytemora carolleeae TaxID=1294199 RepID=UPI000C760142|nr:uncharacterized protein LOC111705626 [Eurytemora carolleeae]|eukprot:XP_023334001.1 uncharacterized protein LOC111705626 [Eurytemora affinis]
MELGSNPPDMSSPCMVEDNSNNTYSPHPVVGRSGQILWIRGLTRLQTQVIGGDRQDRLIPVPYSKNTTDQAIRVVNAFRHGVDTPQVQQATSNPNIQRVLQKQASLNKRLSAASAVSDPDNLLHNSNALHQLKTKSHTETAV